MIRRVVLAVVVAVLVACGDGGDAPVELDSSLQPFADALVTRLESESDLALTPEERECFVVNAVAVIGGDRVSRYPTPEAFAAETDLASLGLAPEEARRLAAALVQCGPGIVESVRDDFADRTGVELDDTQRTCVDGVIDDEFVVDVVAGSFSEAGSAPALEPALADLQHCLAG